MGCATLVFKARPGNLQNRLLAGLIVLGELASSMWGAWGPHATSPAHAYAFWALQTVVYILLIGVYVLFLSTLNGPVARALRRPLVRAAIALGTASLTLAFIAKPSLFLLGVEGSSGYWQWRLQTPPMRVALDLSFLLVHLVGLLVAWQNYQAAPTRGLRRQGFWYLMAFGVRDFLMVVMIVMIAPRLTDKMIPWWSDALSYDRPLIYEIAGVLVPTAALLFTLLLSYGLLRSHLFDVDLKLKVGINKGVVASIFLGVFFVVGLGASEYLLDEFGYLMGALAAGALFLAIKPLQDFGQRVATAALPGVQGTPEYTARRKREVYEDAYASMIQDGDISARERTLLATLAESLGLGPKAVLEIERGVARLVATGAGAPVLRGP